MDKQQKLKIALPILLIVIAFIWGPVITGGGSKAKAKKTKSPSNQSIAVAINGNDLLSLAHANQRNKARTSFSEWGRNPFMLTAIPKASVLEGILWDSQNPKAIINGNILGIGDRVGPGEVVDIRQDAVTIKTGDVEKEFRLGL